MKAPKLVISKLSAPKKVKAGKSARIKVGVDSTGGAVATGAKVCLSVKGRHRSIQNARSSATSSPVIQQVELEAEAEEGG